MLSMLIGGRAAPEGAADLHQPRAHERRHGAARARGRRDRPEARRALPAGRLPVGGAAGRGRGGPRLRHADGHGAEVPAGPAGHGPPLPKEGGPRAPGPQRAGPGGGDPHLGGGVPPPGGRPGLSRAVQYE